MKKRINNLKVFRSTFTFFLGFFLLLGICVPILSQTGGVYTVNGIIRALQTKSFSAAEIVKLIKEKGVNFQITPDIKARLVAAGARPEVIEAVRNNYRGAPKNSIPGNIGAARIRKPAPPTYNDLIARAIDSYNADVAAKLPIDSAGRIKAIEILKQAAALNQNNPAAYQQLGFMSLYGTSKSFEIAEAYMRMAVILGGSAVFRVYHDHTGKFNDTCQGSLYIARARVLFEADDNIHTFDAPDHNVDEIKIDSSSTPLFRKKHSTYKIILRTGDDHAKFRFAPVTGNKEESKMVERLIRGKL